jgi:hypothetical protein
MAAPVWVSRRRYARLTKCSESSIRKAIARGMIRPRASDGLINRREADETWLRWSQVGQRRPRVPAEKRKEQPEDPNRRPSIEEAIGGLPRLHLAVSMVRIVGDDGLLRELVDGLQLEPDQYDALCLLAGLVLSPRSPEGNGEGDPAVIEALVNRALYDAMLRLDDWANGPRTEPLTYPQPAGAELTALARRHGLEGGLYTGWPLD